MALALTHECNRDTRKEIIATIGDPYHFVDSGLSNVSLVGIRYFRCECGREVAEIPAVRQLLSVIARDLVEKPEALAPEEIRFLRKRLGEKQADFGKEIGLKPETLCRMENGDTRVNERADKIIRLYYAFKSQDAILLEKFKEELQEILASWTYSNVPSKIVATRIDNEWAVAVAA